MSVNKSMKTDQPNIPVYSVFSLIPGKFPLGINYDIDVSAVEDKLAANISDNFWPKRKILHVLSCHSSDAGKKSFSHLFSLFPICSIWRNKISWKILASIIFRSTDKT